jgi:hypothetical protein
MPSSIFPVFVVGDVVQALVTLPGIPVGADVISASYLGEAALPGTPRCRR